ncbi:amino acid ABC transporter substrate-binding protein, PAAT family [Pseudomonas delhiensis]|uniref:Amino acid ABC transporter substrate-binding protein, PAAT family n=1 Tax=Pseudomonas delhiensis TaxID=366289 RepID=A0A239MQ11_9PSED|nr:MULTISPECIES: ABC transporter substrate-binding protein [Pseudomonas]PWU30784.1 amino acid ABC transporter substrate-binding protein [Pseudomonas sp. RW407]SDK66526.1 amino acid ABC transporter substrate-binding protein, PAAT family [Pseudomonas delhiensis]SNT44937.1 amino acid ABC transporter substrate-binding protein, PAAT family [Pseudomonas delhiensis]
MHQSIRAFVLACAASVLFAGPAAAETLKVGATSTGVPFTFLDIQSQRIQGMMVDTVEAVGKAAGFDTQIQQTNFAALIPSLTSGKIDLISAAMLKTPPREKVVQFSDPVFSYGEGLVVRADDSGAYTRMDDFKGEVVGAQVGTVFLDELNKRGIFKEVRGYDSINDLLRDLALGRIKAAFADQPVLAYQLARGGQSKVRLVRDYQPVIHGDVSLVLRKDDPALLQRVNQGIASIRADGTLQRIRAKWNLD